jgi:hypothetical protein
VPKTKYKRKSLLTPLSTKVLGVILQRLGTKSIYMLNFYITILQWGIGSTVQWAIELLGY